MRQNYASCTSTISVIWVLPPLPNTHTHRLGNRDDLFYTIAQTVVLQVTEANAGHK